MTHDDVKGIFINFSTSTEIFNINHDMKNDFISIEIYDDGYHNIEYNIWGKEDSLIGISDEELFLFIKNIYKRKK
jgi:hypothetical protein